MNTVTRIKNKFTDRFAADCARVSFGITADDYSEERVHKLVNHLVRKDHKNPLFHPMITIMVASQDLDLRCLLQEKCLLAGINMHELDKDYWAVTTSAYGLMEIARFMRINFYDDRIKSICHAYKQRHDTHDYDVYEPIIIDTPHQHQWFSFEFETEMNTKNQIYTHNVGIAKSSESFRYVDNVRFYVPKKWRGKAENVKQGSSDVEVEENENCIKFTDVLDKCDNWYFNNDLICNEQRRLALPQAQMTRFVMTGTREAWERTLKLRLAQDAQKEVRLIAEQIADEINGDTQWTY